MGKFNKTVVLIILAIVLIFGLAWLIKGATTVSLGTANNFAILAGSTITNTGASIITGDVGLSPGSSITGFPPGIINGTQYASTSAVAIQAKTDLVTAYNNAAGQLPVSEVASELGGTTKTAGIYNSADGTFEITGTLTLNAAGNANAVFIFKTASTLITANDSLIVLTNGAQACNVFWQVGSSATLGTDSTFKGNILALESITLTTGADVEGRILARNGAVTLDTNTVSKATCAVVPDSTSENNYNTITVFKQVINDASGTAKFTDFPLFINGSPVDSGESARFAPGIYTVTETSLPGYTTTFTGNCDSTGKIDHGWYDTHNDVCVVVNDDIGVPPVVPVAPLIDVVKVPNPLSLPAGPGQVVYTYTVSNIGTVPMTGVTLLGDTCSPIAFVSGDINSDSKLDVSEKWVYRCTKTLSETTTNTVVATGYANGISAVDIANAKVVVGLPIVSPLIHITKVPSPLSLPSGSGMVTYTKKVTNPGTVALNNISVTDDKCSVVRYISGDTNNDLKLDPSETWTYTCSTNITKTTTNTAIATGEANGLIATDFALATVVASPKLPSTGSIFDGGNIPWSIILSVLAGIFIFSILFYFVRKKRTV
ncbi:MAG: ice-binding family protein [Candidatus Paceibacterota bacterium]|jgi:hypothetical protein